ncbi:hypothetical protein [Caballeronia sp. LZ016]|uniref:hypothetical protein n=1 Tax=Caballeronia sp. LZ016 TaxID=3038554 RepID=UPI0028630CB4|nr:hypothetical protein [Caballeronia sp. LZ016]MDR5739504.1 hypothetical protein [Caballeronia sp. LZ016]
MQVWDSVLCINEESPYYNTAGFIIRVDRTATPAKITARMDKDSADVAFVETDLKRLG